MFLPNNQFRKALSTAEMEENVRALLPLMREKGWSDEAIAAMLGNWQSESTISCNRPQYSGFPDLKPATGDKPAQYLAFGLPQWDGGSTAGSPRGWWNKIGWYGRQRGIYPDRTDTNPLSDANLQLDYHEFECTQGLQGDPSRKTWVSRHGYSYSWQEFTTSAEDPGKLADVYYWMYEFSSAGGSGTRPAQARKWYDFIKGITPGPSVKSNFLILAYAAGVIK